MHQNYNWTKLFIKLNLSGQKRQKRHILELCPSSVQKKTEKSIVTVSAVDTSDGERSHLPSIQPPPQF